MVKDAVKTPPETLSGIAVAFKYCVPTLNFTPVAGMAPPTVAGASVAVNVTWSEYCAVPSVTVTAVVVA